MAAAHKKTLGNMTGSDCLLGRDKKSNARYGGGHVTGRWEEVATSGTVGG